MFGFAGFYFYIFIREQDLPAGGGNRLAVKELQALMFSAGWENHS